MQVIANSSVAVDTFLVLSGLLVSYSLLKHLNNTGGRINPFAIYLNRYLRLTPVYGFILAFVATLIVYVGSGPNWYLGRISRHFFRN